MTDSVLMQGIYKVRVFLILIMLLSCGKKLPSVNRPVPSGVIVGDVNWKEFSQNNRWKNSIKKNALTVAHLQILSNNSRCNGFLLTNDIIMTSYHCVPDQKTATNLKAKFGPAPGETQERSFSCANLVGYNEKLHYSLIQCSDAPGKLLGTVGLEENPEIVVEDQIYLIHHNCNYPKIADCVVTKLISPGKVKELFNDKLFHSADTLKGSSGAAIFDLPTGLLLGMHFSGEVTDRALQKGPYNVASRLSQVLEDIKINYHDIYLNISLR
jgi:V8-like Glu-specific endopeptidase